MLVLRKPYLLYLGDALLKSDCKTAFGLRDWCAPPGNPACGWWTCATRRLRIRSAAGASVPMDALVSDFLAGAAEALSPDNEPGHWDVIEGQDRCAIPRTPP